MVHGQDQMVQEHDSLQDQNSTSRSLPPNEGRPIERVPSFPIPDLGEDEVVADAASRAGLNPDPILAAGHSETLRAQVSEGWRLAAERDRIFGVPSFVYAGKLYWGQDRMHFLRSAVVRKTKSSLG